MSTENSGSNSFRGRNLVAHQFQPGQSGNPGGRPKKLPITEYLKAQLELPVPEAMMNQLSPAFADLYGASGTFGEALAFQLVAKAATGDVAAMREVLDRTEGKVGHKMATGGESGGLGELVVRRIVCNL